MVNRGFIKNVLVGVILSLFLGIQLIAATANAQGKIEQDLIDKINRNPSAMITVIVTYIDKADPSIIKRHNGKLGYDLKIINGHSARIRAGNVLNMAREAKIKKIYMNKPVKALLDESVPLIKADAVHAQGITGAGVKVCIVDTGVNDDHPALNPLSAEYDFVNDDSDASDDNGHGTYVAGIIASNDPIYNIYKGVAYGASLLAAKVLDAAGSGTYEDVIAGVDWCVENEADIISMSLGGGTSGNCDGDPLSMAVNNAVVYNGVVVSVAAGNEGTAGITVPGCASKVIAVGAVDKTLNVPGWSSRGPEMDIVAPGVDITSSWLNGGFESHSGTSASCPHVSGVAALLLEANSNATMAEVKDAMYSTATPVNICYECTLLFFGICFLQEEVECTPEIVGAGVVDAYAAYSAINPTGSACLSDDECDDENPCTDDTCVNAGEIDAYCSYTNVGDGILCDDGQFCTIDDVCTDTICSGTPRDCSDEVNCTVDSCDEDNDMCVHTPDNSYCDDGSFCNGEETCDDVLDCQAGTPVDCDDDNDCTTDNCNEENDACEYINVADNTLCTDGVCCSGVCIGAEECPTAVKCWSGNNGYLYRNRGQASKFCKCAMGNYGYSSYSYTRGRKTVYRYVDSGDNENWEVTSRSSNLPVYQVKCTDEEIYPTDQDYYYTK